MIMKKKEKLAYEKLSSAARFREQLRLTFAGVIVATAFVAPDNNVLFLFLKVALSVSAVFAALFLIASAARVKYTDPGRIYEAFYAGERFRMSMFDWSVNIFGFAILFFVGLLLTGAFEKMFNIELGGVWTWLAVFVATIIIGVVIILLGRFVGRYQSKKKLPRL